MTIADLPGVPGHEWRVREAITAVYAAVGYLGVALWVALETVIIPIPSELVLPFAGFLVGADAAGVVPLEPLTGAPWAILPLCHSRSNALNPISKRPSKPG